MNWILLILGLNIIAVALIYILLRRRIDRAIRSTELLSQIEVEIDNIITELNQTTERNITLVEDKIRTLSLLMEQSDKKIFLINRELNKKQKEETVVYKRPRINNHPIENTGDDFPANVNPSVRTNISSEERLAKATPVSYAQTQYEQASNVQSEPDVPSSPEEERPVKINFQANEQRKAQEPPKTSKQRVLEMYTRGEDVNSIASKLNITLGEIELILSMNQRSAPER
ncbi:MAG: hypothetical protein JEY99_12425 [Spirochaetales bacterium]|nr:hypothetical protein [Spirochaetales bacterium]